jgi:uncharacterized membrane protein
LSYGDENPSSADKTPRTRPDGGVRQPNPGSVPPVAGSAAADGGREWRDDSQRLEEYRAGARNGDDQRRPNLLEPEPRQAEPAVLEALRVELESQQWSGPLPPPATLYQYEQVQPGLAERIVAMAETVATGEIKTRDRLARAEIEQARTGQALAFVLTIIAVGAAIYFFAADDIAAGCAFVSFPVIMLIRSFLTSLRGEGRRHDTEDQADNPGRSSEINAG